MNRNEPTFFFYDLETSGLSAREDRIMQFAGQRTDLDLNPVGEAVNLLVKMTDDTLPAPEAVMVTKITPQSTQQDGLTEAELCRFLTDEIFTPNTCAVGYNSVRFDDEFLRHLFWRNFYDPYEWQWQDGRSRWDLLDVVRLTRALRPEGINWPVTETGVATNRLELITKLNGIEHAHAHDALSDVEALIAVTRLIREKQPRLYDYLFELRAKKKVQELANLDDKKPFVYASGRYAADFNKATVAFPLAPAPHGNLLVFDLRYNLDDLLAEKDRETFYPIVKILPYNKCPAVAPLGVLEQADGWQKLGLSPEIVRRNRDALLRHPDFAERMRSEEENRPEFPPAPDPESALYDGFLEDRDRTTCAAVRAADANRLADFHPNFLDDRLAPLLLHYKAKNFPTALAADEVEKWEEYRRARLTRQAPRFLDSLKKLASGQNAASPATPAAGQGAAGNSEEQTAGDDFILEELSLWYQSLASADY